MNLRFEWDARKAFMNRMKHGVLFEEAMTVLTIHSPTFSTTQITP